jgi:formylglycine-generating enzyme required for sulfatase activity/pimeloyl-ACP methyl ester carboxylesterase
MTPTRLTVLFTILALAVAALALRVGIANDLVFSDRFEPRGESPVIFATVELRDADGQVKAAAESDVSGHFPLFSSSLIESGDAIVVYGGLWRGTPFAGEFRLLMADPEAPQIVTPITTLVSAVAARDFITGDTPVERLDAAVAWLSDLFMIDADWNTTNPSRTTVSFEHIEAAPGIQNWVLALLPHIESGDIPNEWMNQFPATNAGVIELAGLNEGFLWLTEDTGIFTLSVTSLLEPEPDWAFALHSGPDWLDIDTEGAISYAVPDDEPAGPSMLEIEVTNLATGQSRILTAPYEVQEGEVVAEVTVGSGGGMIWHPSGLYGIEAPEGTFADNVTLQLLAIGTDEESNRSRFRILPFGTELNKGLIFQLGDEPETGLADRDVPASCAVPSDLLESGWSPRSCVMGAYLEISKTVCFETCYQESVVSLQRLPEGQSAYDLPDIGSYIPSTPDFTQASVLTARCSDCAGKTPLVFVHGYKAGGDFSGGSSYWGDLRQLFHDFNDGETFAVYEFRYRSNARFQDIARDLGNALELVANETGQKAHVIAHSFGGLVARTYLQGLTSNAATISGFSNCQTSRHPYVESLVTLGTPHSGIAPNPINQHGIWFPDGRHFKPMNECGQLSCWQAGNAAKVFGGSSHSDLAGLFGVDEIPGEIVAQLANFSANPLPVATRALLSMDMSTTGLNRFNFQPGDSLISYQGQRFSPLLSCNGSNCQNARITMMNRLEIAGQNLGHCLVESVLGADTLQPLPFEPVPASEGVTRFYKHSTGALSSTVSMQPYVVRSAHLPDLNPDGSGSWASNHDTFNKIHDWLGLPPERNLLIQIEGQGSVQIDSGGEHYHCNTNCFVALPPDAEEVTATITADPATGGSFDRFIDCPSISGNQCTVSVGPRTRLTARFTGGGQAELRVTVSGSGSVTVDPGEHVCSGSTCSYPYAPGTSVTLTAQGGTFNGWSGACSGSSTDCTRTLGPAGTWLGATASFTVINPGSTFKDCPDCPTMVMIPSGSFVQGSPSSEPESLDRERPQRTVNVPAFAMGQTAVTFAEWDACVADGGCTHNLGDAGWGRGSRPVINVNWNDAQQYVTWLSNKTGQDYRLPSESEREYATRAGTTGRFNTGDCITTDQANFRGTAPAQGCPSGIYREQTLPVGSFAPNAFGLYDSHGNVWEWVQDCWNGNYNGAPTDGSAWMTGDCSLAVLRGGSWGHYGFRLRSAHRFWNTRGNRNNSNGFRVARSVAL